MPVCAFGPKGKVSTYAFLDEGATITLIDQDLAKTLGLKGRAREIRIEGINGLKVSAKTANSVSFEVSGSFGKSLIKGALTLKNIKLPSQSILPEMLKPFESYRNVTLSPYFNARAQILIGQDNWDLIASLEIVKGKHSNLGASRSLLGWSIHGPLHCVTKKAEKVLAITKNEHEGMEEQALGGFEDYKTLDETIKSYFELEAIGVSVTGKPRSVHDRARKILENTSRFCGDHWETGLLWKEDFAPENDSYSMALKRLRLLEKRLDRDKNYSELYYAEMDRFIKKGYAEKLNKTEKRPSREWYLPHFGVTNINKPNKVRLVFDAAAKSGGVSLNDQLDAGPDLLQSLPGVLIRFRQYEIAAKGDIADMFLRIKVRESDRGAQRFLWRGKHRDIPPDEYEMNTLIFGGKASPCSAIFVKNENASRFKLEYPVASESIERDSYMDDFLSSWPNREMAKKIVEEVKHINAAGGFEMHSWASNDSSILPITPEEKNVVGRDTRLCQRGGERVLGLFWDTVSDNLKFNAEFSKIQKDIISGEKIPTKREVLKVIMSVFDPLGLLSPFTLRSKTLLQDIWRSGVGWDTVIKKEEFNKWREWLAEIEKLKSYKIPRCMSPQMSGDSMKHVQLHVFCDASFLAYSAVAYLRFTNFHEKHHVSIVMAKSRVAPIKQMIIPRLELQAALLGARLAKYVCEELDIKITQRVLWSDSETVLSWLKTGPKKREIFVAHRLGEIAELTLASEWRWVPTEKNPADDATRINKTVNYSNDRWTNGPKFLKFSESEWPKPEKLIAEKTGKTDSCEEQREYIGVVLATSDYLPIYIRLAGWTGLLVIARRVNIYFQRWKNKAFRTVLAEKKEESENYWYRVIQRDCFPDEIAAIQRGRELKKGSKILQVRPFLDKQLVLRAYGRVKIIDGIEFNSRPVILYAKHPATKRLIAEYHRKYYHSSNDTVVNELRQQYFIIGLRGALKSLVSRCLTCRIQRGKPKFPLMSSLPDGRLAYNLRPFTHCGVDYFGPMMVKIGRRREKRWGVLFTCLTVRAIHLELAHSLDASSAIMALQRLASRRGAPLVIYSDNGTNFRRGSKDLKEAIAAIDKKAVTELAASKKIEWRFSAPDSPHFGVIWEVMVRSVKRALAVIMHDQAPSEEVMLTVLTEIEHMVNSRPLTHVSADPRDEEALTPNHFLIGTSSSTINLGVFEKNACLRKRYRLVQHFSEAFWKRWLREYLPTLLPRKKWTQSEPPPKVGDIV